MRIEPPSVNANVSVEKVKRLGRDWAFDSRYSRNLDVARTDERSVADLLVALEVQRIAMDAQVPKFNGYIAGIMDRCAGGFFAVRDDDQVAFFLDGNLREVGRILDERDLVLHQRLHNFPPGQVVAKPVEELLGASTLCR